MSQQDITRPVVLGGPGVLPEGAIAGEVAYDRWGGTAPSIDLAANYHGPVVSWPTRRPRDGANVVAAVAGEWAFNGPFERQVELELARRAGVEPLQLTMVNTGSAALVVGMRAADVRYASRQSTAARLGRRGEVVTTATSFSATPNAIAEIGRRPVLVDVRRSDLMLDPDAVEAAITSETVGICLPLLYGSTGDLEAYRQIAERHGVWLCLDAAQAPFAAFDGLPLARFADVVTTSHQYGKVLQSGEGGSVWSADAEIAALIRSTVTGKVPAQTPAWWPERVPSIMNTNVRFNEFLAGVLASQLELFDGQEERRSRQMAQLLRRLGGAELPFRPLEHVGAGVTYKFGLWNESGLPLEAVMYALRREGLFEVGAAYRSLTNPLSGFDPAGIPGWADLASQGEPCPVSGDAFARVFLIAHQDFLRDAAAEQVLQALRNVAAHTQELSDWWRTRS